MNSLGNHSRTQNSKTDFLVQDYLSNVWSKDFAHRKVLNNFSAVHRLSVMYVSDVCKGGGS